MPGVDGGAGRVATGFQRSGQPIILQYYNLDSKTFDKSLDSTLKFPVGGRGGSVRRPWGEGGGRATPSLRPLD